MLDKVLKNWKSRNCIFIFLSIFPFIVFQQFRLDVDAWFHLSRIYEIVKDIENGLFFS